ncbi:MAG: radical SAM protein, partial [candidate division Zixibacteria bacterium]|nr:radical SAM protein [candidate division Zixibacteria bacterium]
RQLEEIEGISWIRLVYLHPQMLKSDLIDYISKSYKTLPYYDLPIQHIHDDMLSRMRRQVRREKIEGLLSEIRSKRPDSTIRTTFIVGFPGETESHFGALYEFAESFKFDRMGAFAYSLEEGSSAALMPDQVPEEDKALRLDTLNELQFEIVASKNRKLIGKEITALIDTVSAETSEAVGRTMADCPEIDPIIRIRQKINGDKKSAALLKSGDIVRVLVTETDGTDLIAELKAA